MLLRMVMQEVNAGQAGQDRERILILSEYFPEYNERMELIRHLFIHSMRSADQFGLVAL